jgi:hypothetical protein
MPSLLENLFGYGNKSKKLPTIAPYQERALQGAVENPIQNSPLYGGVSDFLQKIYSGDPSAFEAFEAPALRQFNEQLIPQLAERFTGAGTGAGAINSSAFQNQATHAATDLSERLAAMRANIQQQSLYPALAYAQQPYQNALSQAQIHPFGYAHQPGSTGLFGNLLSGLAGGASQGFGLGGGSALFNTISGLGGFGQAGSGFGGPSQPQILR